MKEYRFVVSLLAGLVLIGIAPSVFPMADTSVVPVTEVPLAYTEVLRIKSVYLEDGTAKAIGCQAVFAQPDAAQLDDWHQPDHFPGAFQLIDQGDDEEYVIHTDAQLHFTPVNEAEGKSGRLKNAIALQEKVEDGYPAWIAEYRAGNIIRLTGLPLRIRSVYAIDDVHTGGEMDYLWCAPQIMTEHPAIEGNRTVRAVGTKRYALSLAPDARLTIESHFVDGAVSRDYAGGDFSILKSEVSDERKRLALLTMEDNIVQSAYVLYEP